MATSFAATASAILKGWKVNGELKKKNNLFSYQSFSRGEVKREEDSKNPKNSFFLFFI